MTDPIQGHRGEVITFYSFKGGVGRSMALANVAAIYAQRGKRVLALDFDFEAPGLHRYFLPTGAQSFTPAEPQMGVLNFFDALRTRLSESFRDGQAIDDAVASPKLRAMIRELLDDGGHLYRVQLRDPDAKPSSLVHIDFVAAARFDATYPELVRIFDWQGFYDDYAEVFPAIVNELRDRYDVILIDSRTGVTDIGSICTMVLPDKLVLVFTPNEQSLAGALDAGWQAVQGRKAAPEPRLLPVFPVVSRVEEGEEHQKRAWIDRARRSFERLLGEIHGIDHVDLETYFNIVRIPHKSFYAYGEQIAATQQSANEFGSISQAFHRLADALEHDSAIKAQQALGLRFQRQGIAALVQLKNRLGNSGKIFEPIAKPIDMIVRLTEAMVLIQEGQAAEALAMYEEIVEQAQSASGFAMQEVLAGGLVGKAQALMQLGRYEEALSAAADTAARYESTGAGSLQKVAHSAMAVAGLALVYMAKRAWQSGDDVAARALIESAESKLALARGQQPRNGTLLGYYGYAAFLAGHESEPAIWLTQGIKLGGNKVREGVLKVVAVEPLPRDDDFRALLASIPDPPAGEAPLA